MLRQSLLSRYFPAAGHTVDSCNILQNPDLMSRESRAAGYPSKHCRRLTGAEDLDPRQQKCTGVLQAPHSILRFVGECATRRKRIPQSVERGWQVEKTCL